MEGISLNKVLKKVIEQEVSGLVSRISSLESAVEELGVLKLNVLDGGTKSGAYSASADIVIYFDEVLMDNSGAKAIKDAITLTDGTTPVTVNSATISQNALTINFDGSMPYGASMTLTVSKDESVKSIKGAEMLEDFVLTFVVEELLVLATTPLDGAVDVAVDTTIVVEFDDTLKDNTGASNLETEIQVLVGEVGQTIASAAVVGDTLTITMNANFANDDVVTVVIPAAGCLAGQDDQLLKEDYSFSFTIISAV